MRWHCWGAGPVPRGSAYCQAILPDKSPHPTKIILPSCTPHNSTTTTVMEKALKDLELHKGEAEFSIRKTAERNGLSRTTLQRKYNQETRTNAEEAEYQKNLTTQQEEELVTYIQDLTSKGLPPTRSMLQNYACVVAKKEVGMSWVSRFLVHYKDNLLPK
ncbi:hypothetical protein EJ02DRAFT_491038 [Clathrospora elynae]|uniref:HTH CENPB-type domain-containing protein n=1 Tax=Clathrospora elynae TaxID=706981 RepID=A0A6A5SM42_9PLEO|nr:hypothetical protein EJ02DRAFT_491038 [Clathrospora elynae]